LKYDELVVILEVLKNTPENVLDKIDISNKALNEIIGKLENELEFSKRLQGV
jgi:hypothetical protein